MNGFVLLIILILIAGAFIYFFQLPQRSVANFCSTYENGKHQLLLQWSQDEKKTSDDGFSQLFKGFTTVVSYPTDMANFFGKLDSVAPDDIEPDIATIKTAFQNENGAMSTMASGNLMGGLGAGLMAGLQSQNAFQRLSSYIKNNCEPQNETGNQTTSPQAP